MVCKQKVEGRIHPPPPPRQGLDSSPFSSTTATLRYVACVSVQNRARPPLENLGCVDARRPRGGRGSQRRSWPLAGGTGSPLGLRGGPDEQGGSAAAVAALHPRDDGRAAADELLEL